MEPKLDTPLRSALLPIGRYPWGGAYRPAAWARCGLDDQALTALLWCVEDRRDVPRYRRSNEPVYLDSCLEAFFACYPGLSPVYLNFETNRAGAMLLQMGVAREGRRFLTPQDFPAVPFPQARAFETPAGWGVRLTIPRAFLQAVYQTDVPLDPHSLRGNFYKCGAVPEREHYAVWAPIAAPAPDYHRPECFQPFWEGAPAGDAQPGT